MSPITYHPSADDSPISSIFFYPPADNLPISSITRRTPADDLLISPITYHTPADNATLRRRVAGTATRASPCTHFFTRGSLSLTHSLSLSHARSLSLSFSLSLSLSFSLPPSLCRRVAATATRTSRCASDDTLVSAFACPLSDRWRSFAFWET